VTGDATPPLSREEVRCLCRVLMWLQPMGCRTLEDEDGQPAVRACGDQNVRPYVPGIRQALQEAAEAEIDPAMLYRRAVATYELLDVGRRREHPEWNTWPAPPFEAVEPVTWPPLELEVQYSVHAARVISALWAREEESQRVERLRRILRRAKERGLDPAAVYRQATKVDVAGGVEVDRRPSPPPYEQVRPDRDAPQS
jgi:hypothetical protein